MTQNIPFYDGSPAEKARIYKDRKATWLELFYDLAYVAVIAQLTYLVGKHHTALELAFFVLLFLMIFSSWWLTTVNRNLSEIEDTVAIVAVQVQMFFALVMSFFLPTVFDGGAEGFVMGFIGTRFVWLFLLARNYRLHPERAPKTRNIQMGYTIGTFAWIASLFVPAPFQIIMWIATLIFDFLVPSTKGKGNKITYLNTFHFQERLGLFVLLIMGESVLVVALSSGISGVIQQGTGTMIAILGLLIMVALWWLYFPYIEGFVRGKRAAQLQKFMYGHIVLFIGIILLAVGIKELIGGVKSADGATPLSFLVAVSLVVMMIAFLMIMRAMGHLVRRHALDSLLFIVLLASAFFGLWLLLSPVALLLILVMIFVSFVLYVHCWIFPTLPANPHEH